MGHPQWVPDERWLLGNGYQLKDKAERYERRSVIITSNLVFSQWDQIFHNPMTTAAAFDQVVHHSIIVKFGKEISSYRANEAAMRRQELA